MNGFVREYLKVDSGNFLWWYPATIEVMGLFYSKTKIAPEEYLQTVETAS
jgi:hypothetical protein